MESLRAEFPICRRLAYLNAGTNGPVPARAIEAQADEVRAQAERGRGDATFFERCIAQGEALRGRFAAVLGCPPEEVALTTSTTGGVNTVLPALGLGPGDEVLTSDEEHPGLLAPLAAGRARDGFEVRMVPFAELPGEVRPATKLIAASHVSWVGGKVADTESLKRSGVPLLLDGAQGLGAVPVDVRQLGCDFYATSGQKWPCGPNGLGYLYVKAERIEELLPPAPGFGSLAFPERANELVPEFAPTARRFDAFLPAPQSSAWALAALDVLEAPGLATVQEGAIALAASLADRLTEAGVEVAPRGRSTLVSWKAEQAEELVERWYEQGVVVRAIPGSGLIRASIGGWTSDEDVERLVELAV